MNGVCVKDGWNQPDLLLSQFDFVSGKVVKTIHTTTLHGRCWKNTLAEMNCKTNGKMKSDAQTVYVKDLTLSDESAEAIATYLEHYQDAIITNAPIINAMADLTLLEPRQFAAAWRQARDLCRLWYSKYDNHNASLSKLGYPECWKLWLFQSPDGCLLWSAVRINQGYEL